MIPLGSFSDRRSRLRPSIRTGVVSPVTSAVRISLFHCGICQLVKDSLKPGSISTYHSLEVGQTEPLADIIAEDDQVRPKETPVFWTGSVVEFEPILPAAGADIKDKRLIKVPEKGNGSFAFQIMTAFADSPGWVLVNLACLPCLGLVGTCRIRCSI